MCVYMYTNQPAADTVQPSFVPHLPIARRRRGLKPILSTRVVSSFVGRYPLPPQGRKGELWGANFPATYILSKGV